jgi:hypothetical protein
MTEAARLPFVDEHSIEVGAAATPTWGALLRAFDALLSAGAAPRIAGLLGCRDVVASGPRPLAPGSTVPGFHVAAAKEGRELVLAGSHRFSEYALTFRLDELGGERMRLRAETRARFPGVKGRAYRTLVIGSRGHVVATRRILAAVRRRAERG